MKTNLIYFSATDTTRKITSALASALGNPIRTHDLTLSAKKPSGNDIFLGPDDLAVIGMPVYAGRIPQLMAEPLRRFKGRGTPAILVAVYGNREYDDALVEMQDIAQENGFTVIAAAAFIAQHSIFPATAAGRPDQADMEKVAEFAAGCRQQLESFREESGKISENAGGVENGNGHPAIRIKGNRPYKQPGTPALQVMVNDSCFECGNCVEECPTGAIDPSDPHVTDPDKCIRCGRCIVVCPAGARGYFSPQFPVAAANFQAKNALRKEPEFFYRY